MAVHLIPPIVPYDSNVYVLTGSRNFLIDTGTGLRSGVLIERIEDAVGDSGLDSVILTHCHFDHIGGLKAVVDRFGCKAFCLPPDSDHIRNADSRFILGDMFGIRIQGIDVSDMADGDVFDNGEHRLRVIPTPGHTAGSACLYDEVSCDLFSGDTVFLDSIGRCDFPSGSIDSIARSIARLSNIDIRGLYPGHGEISATYGSDCIARALRYVGD